MIGSSELIILLRILAAHILADFFLQRYKWIVDKRLGVQSPYLYFHVAIVGVLTYLFLADWDHVLLPLFIMITHFLIDWWKSTVSNCTRNFVIDQILHVLMLVIGWLWYVGAGFADLSIYFALFNTVGFWVVLSSFLLILRPVGFLISKATSGWQNELEDIPSTLQGLTKAGTWIGYLERLIILTFILIGQYSAIGFLIAAKSIFRFSGKIDNEESHKHAEYILIGTLMSFFMAVVIGVIARYFLAF